MKGRLTECLEGCGMCCLCQPEITPMEMPFFKENHPEKICRIKGPDGYTGIKLKKGKGSCVFLDSKRHCEVYNNRTQYCRQYPYHIYVSDRVKVELDLSCRGVWTGKGNDAESEAKKIVKAAENRIIVTLPEARDVYNQFNQYATEAGVFKNPKMLRMTAGECIGYFANKDFLYRALQAANDLPQMTIADALKPQKPDYKLLEEAARTAAIESLSTEDPLSMPVYCQEDYSWNLFSHDGQKIEQLVLDDEGNFKHRSFVDQKDISLPDLENEGQQLLQDYIRILNERDSFLGSVYFLEDANGYEDDLANAYYGSLASAALDVMWRAQLLNKLFGTGFGKRGIREAIMFYDMDRLDAPTIGAFV